MADVGANGLAMIEGRVHEGQRVTVRIISADPLVVRVQERPLDSLLGLRIETGAFFSSISEEREL